MTFKLDKSNWKRVAFEDVVTNVNVAVKDPETAGIDRVIAMEHLDPGKLKISRWGGLEDGTTFTRRVRPGQTLFGKRRAYQRKAAYAEFDAICSSDILVFEADNDRLLSEFLPFIVQSNGFYAHALGTSAGSLSPRTNWRDLAHYEFKLPPIDEQKRLADLLWTIERHKQSIAVGAIERVEDLYLEDLLAESAGNLMPISSMGSVLMGRQRSPIHATGDHMISYLRVANVGDNELRLQDVKQMNFTPEEQERFDVRSGDILVSEGQSRELVGQSVLIADLPERMCFQNTLIRFRADHSVVRPEYAQALFRACLHAGVFVSIAAQTTSIAHLGVQRFAQLQVRVPGLDEQDRVMAELARIQTARESVQAESSALVMLSSQISRLIFGAAE